MFDKMKWLLVMVMMFTAGNVMAGEPIIANYCGGPEGLSYIKKARQAADAVKGIQDSYGFEINVVVTEGGGENIAKVQSGECAFGIAPIHMANKAGLAAHSTLFMGYGHLVCRKSTVGDAEAIWDILPDAMDGKKLTVAVGGKNSASFDTWKELGRLDSDYANKLNVVNVSFTKAIAQLKQDRGIISCAWAASGVGSKGMMHVNFEDADDHLVMLEVNDKDFNDGKNLEFGVIDSTVYPYLLNDGIFSGTNIETVVSKVVLIVNEKWRLANPDAAAMIIGASSM